MKGSACAERRDRCWSVRRARGAVEMATRIRTPSSRMGGVLWFPFVVAMWVAFLDALVVGRVDVVSRWVTDVPVVLQSVVWLLTFPWLRGTAVCQSSWADWVPVAWSRCSRSYGL